MSDTGAEMSSGHGAVVVEAGGRVSVTGTGAGLVSGTLKGPRVCTFVCVRE